jgi:rhodanese-related sulfurtransferase
VPPNLYNGEVERKGKIVVDYILLGAVVLILIAYFVITMFRLRKAVTNLTQGEFIEGYRKAQLIDVRETKDFDAGHILGARNIPYSQFRQRFKEIRPDKPVYLYDQNGGKSARAALFLKKKGYEQLFHLQGGFRLWSGKVKSK